MFAPSLPVPVHARPVCVIRDATRHARWVVCSTRRRITRQSLNRRQPNTASKTHARLPHVGSEKTSNSALDTGGFDPHDTWLQSSGRYRSLALACCMQSDEPVSIFVRRTLLGAPLGNMACVRSKESRCMQHFEARGHDNAKCRERM